MPRLEPAPVVAEPPVAGGPNQRGGASRVGNVETAPEGDAAPPPSWLTNKRKIALGVGVIALGAAVTGVLLGRSAFAPTVTGSVQRDITLQFSAARGPVSYPFTLAGFGT